MANRLIAIVAIVLAAATATALLPLGPAPTALTRDADEADRVTLYQNGLAAVTVVRSFEGDGQDRVFSFVVPQSTIFDSIRVLGDVTVREFRSTVEDAPTALPGDRVVVHAEHGRFAGTLLDLGSDRILVATANGTLLVPMQRVVALEVIDQQPPAQLEGTATVTVRVSAPAGTHTVSLSYLAQGPGWTPSYDLDVETGQLAFFGTLTGLADWSGVELELVAGQPRTVHEKSVFQVELADRDFAAAGAGVALAFDAEPAFAPAQAFGELHRYRYGQQLDLRRGETVRLPMLAGAVDILRHYYDVAAGPYEAQPEVLERFQLRNTFADPLPSGTVGLYRGDTWIASDTLPAIAPDGEGNVTASLASSVKASVKHVSHKTATLAEPSCGQYGCRGRAQDTDVYVVKVRNHKADAEVDVRTVFHAGRPGTVTGDPKPDEHVDGRLEWNDVVRAGRTLEYTVTIVHQYET